MVKDFEGYVMVADQLGEMVSFTSEEAGMIIDQTLKTDYQGVSPDQLTADERFRLAAGLQRKYRLTVDQLAEGLRLPSSMVAQALNSKQYR